jgi:hypothetical protein
MSKHARDQHGKRVFPGSAKIHDPEASEAVPQRVWRDPFGQPGQFGSHVADTVQLACAHLADTVTAGEHPHRGTRDAPPVA